MVTAKSKPAGEPVFDDGVGHPDEFVNPAQDVVQSAMDEATAQGFHGVSADDTPNEHYTVAGVTSGKPTPETTKGQS